MDTLSYKTISANKATVNKRWYIVDAEGKTLGRLCSSIAKVIRGKNKPDFTPHVDCGDNIIVINASKLSISNNKLSDKIYLTYSGYHGGQKKASLANMMAKKPETVIEKAVKGMLPKNKLGKAIFHNLFVYAGSEHPHQAQKPEKLEF